MNEDIWNKIGEFTSEKLQFFIEPFARAKWIIGTNVVAPNASELNFTSLGQQRVRELFQIQQILFPKFFGNQPKANDGPSRASAQASFDAILAELNAASFSVQQKEFLMGFVRQAVKCLGSPESPPAARPIRPAPPEP